MGLRLGNAGGVAVISGSLPWSEHVLGEPTQRATEIGTFPALSGHPSLRRNLAWEGCPRLVKPCEFRSTLLNVCAASAGARGEGNENGAVRRDFRLGCRRQRRGCAELGAADRSEERRVGKECVGTCRSRGSRYHKKKK